MHPLMRSFAQRAALAAGRRRGGCGSGKKGALPLAQQEVRAQMRAARDAEADAEALAFLRARAEAEVVAAIYLKEGVKMGFAFLGGAYATMLYALYRAAA